MGVNCTPEASAASKSCHIHCSCHGSAGCWNKIFLLKEGKKLLVFVSHLLFYTPGWRETKWSKIPFLRKQHDGQDLNTRPPDLEFKVLTAVPQMPLIAIHCRYFKIICLKCTLQWNPINMVTNGVKFWLYLWVTLITRVFFAGKCRVVLPGAKKSGRNNEVIDTTIRLGSTVVAFWLFF